MMVLVENKSKYIAFLILILVIFIIPLKTQALLAPQVFLTELDITKTSFNPGEQIEGRVSLWNYEDFVISDLVFHFQLLGDEVDGVPTQMIDEREGEEIFSILAGQKITKSFSYTLPSNLPKGNFVFRVQLATSRGEEMGWIDKVISVGGEGKFLTLDNYWIVKEGKNLPAGGGVYYQPGEVPQIRFDITNDTNFTIVAFPKIITFKRNIGGEIIKTQEEKSIIAEPGQKKTLKTNLPQLGQPESYLSEVRLYLEDTSEPISNSISFRWIISGEDAEILSVAVDKGSYQAGEEAEVKVQYTGPAHFEVEGGEGELEVKLYDEQGKVVGEKKEEIELKVGQIIVSVPIEESVVNPKIETKITKDGKVLDQYQFQTIPIEKEEIPEEVKKVGFFEKNKKLIISILSIALIIIIIMYFLKIKKKKSLTALILLILISSGLLFVATNVLAATEVDGGLCDTTVLWNRPLPDQTLAPGDTIKFSGRFKVTGCADGLFYNKIEFFITEDRDIPLVKAGDYCCKQCLGATSKYYGACSNIQDMQWCNELKILDQSQPNVYKLATIYPKDVLWGFRPYAIKYNQKFTIPAGLGFSGPVRFYIQYSGTHWGAHWHWNITYQKGYRNSPPTAAISCDASGCKSTGCTGYTGCPFTLKNDSSDPDGKSDIIKSEWDVLNWGGFPDLTCTSPNALCNFTPQPLSPGNYTVKLTVEDSAGQSSDTATKYFTILQEAIADFKCSLDNSTWQDCENIKPNAKETVYFLDQSSPSQGASYITSRKWIFEDGDPAQNIGNETNPLSHFQSQGPREVTLIVTDNRGRTNRETKVVSVQVPLPWWREVSPIGWLGRFLASISNWFRIEF